jgi:hypothetical protein
MDSLKSQKLGYVYVANGEEFRWLASESIKSLLKFTEPCNIQLFTDKIDINIEPYKSMVTLLPNIYLSDLKIIKKASKIYGMINSKFDQSIYLDCDTYIANDLKNCFSLLDICSMSLAKDHHGAALEPEDLKYYLNTGVVVYDRNLMLSVFEEWLRIFMLSDGTSDQKVLMDLIHLNSLQKYIYVMPDSFNYRAALPTVITGKLHVLHLYEDINRPSNKIIADFINSTTSYRIFDLKNLTLEVYENGIQIKEKLCLES